MTPGEALGSREVRARIAERLDRLAEQWAPPAADGVFELAPDLAHGDDASIGPRDGRGRLWDSRRTRAVLVVLAAALAVAAWTWWQGRPTVVEAIPVGIPTDSARPGTDGDPAIQASVSVPGATPMPESAATGDVVVHVVGAVASPGVVRLPAGSRVDDAIRAAGGARTTKALASVNLARVIVDGEQIIVDSAGLAAVTTRAGQSTISLNHADAGELETLPGVGPVLAARIVEWRTAHGAFRSIDELAEVSGIGSALMSDLKTRVRL